MSFKVKEFDSEYKRSGISPKIKVGNSKNVMLTGNYRNEYTIRVHLVYVSPCTIVSFV